MEYRKLSEIKKLEGNPRVIRDKEFKTLCNSIRDNSEYFEARPVILSNRTGELIIIAGNQRYEAAKSLKLKQVPTFLIEGLTELKEKEIIIRDNISNGDFNFDILANEWSDLPLVDWGVDLPEDWLNEGGGEGLTNPDEVPEVPKVATTKPGDIWLCGKHRVMCGDSTKAEDVERLMGGVKADMVFTSPPYWVGFEYENESEKESILVHIDNAARMLTKTSNRIIINTASIFSITKAEKLTGRKQPAIMIDWWVDAMNRNNFLLRHIRIWGKMGGVMPSRANDKIDANWEYIANFTTEEETVGFITTFNEANIKAEQNKGTPPWAVKSIWMDIQGAARGSGHVAAFPVTLPKRYIAMYTKVGDLLYEPYCGSGTTLIGCEQTGRVCNGMEIDPLYVDVTVQRWEQYTGEKSKLEDR